MASNPSTIVEVPQIVVTEPSPQPIEEDAANIPVSMSFPQTPEADEAGPTDRVTIPKAGTLVTSGGFTPSGDHPECTADVAEESSNPSEAPVTVYYGPSNEPKQRTRCGVAYDNFCNWACRFRETKYMILFQVFFLIVPIFTAYIGGTSIDYCPMSPTVPILIFMMGITGCVIMVCQIAMLMQKNYMNERHGNLLLTTITNCGYFALFLLLFTEMASFIGQIRYTDPTDVGYCDVIFYYYTYWLNWCALVFILLMVVLCAPKSCASRLLVQAP